jgi:hypothetical protein
MDKAGRFDMQDGLMIAKIVSDITDKNKQERYQTNTKNYLNKIGKGETIDRNDPNFDYRAYLSASALVLQEKNADQEVQKNKFAINEKQRQENQADIDGRIVKANDLMQRGMEDKALDTLIPVYQYMPDGYTFKDFKTDEKGNVDRSQMVLLAPDGKTEITEPTPPLDQAMSTALRFSKSYKDTYHQAKQKASEANAKAIINNEIWATKDGKEAVYVPFMDVDKTGNYVLKETWRDPQTGKTLKGFDNQTGKEVKSKLDFRSPEYWKQEAEKLNAATSREGMKASTERTKQATEITAERAPLENEKLKADTELAKKRAAAAGKTDSTKAEEAKRKKFKEDLELQLKPFTGSKPAYDAMGEMTDEGKTALDAAMKLVTKYKNKDDLTKDEKAKLKYALRAVDMYGQISDTVSSDYGGGKSGGWEQYRTR